MADTRNDPEPPLTLLDGSPCVGICQLGPDGHCTGCRRSRDEIAAWQSMSAYQRDGVNRRILREAHPAVRVRLLGHAGGGGRRRGGRKARVRGSSG